MRVKLLVFLLGVIPLSSMSTQARTLSLQFEPTQKSSEYATAGIARKAAKRMLVFDAVAQSLPWSSLSLRQAATIFQHTNTEHEPDDGEGYRSQEMHLLAFFMYKEAHRINGGEFPVTFLGPYRYTVVMGLPKALSETFVQDEDTKSWNITPNMMSDEERLRNGFPFGLFSAIQSTRWPTLDSDERNTLRDEEVAKLYLGDQLTRSLFKKDEMIFNRYIERVTDSQRRARLYEMMAEDVPWDAKTLLDAAVILNDTQSVLIYQGKTRFQLQENHLFAFFLSRKAFLMGKAEAAPLIVESLNTYIKVSEMPDDFGIYIKSEVLNKICQKEPRISVERWGKAEFPFHLGSKIKPLCIQPEKVSNK